MLEVRRSRDRGQEAYSWLSSAHTFSFGSYYDPRHVGFRSLRVINQDTVQPGAGFPPHGHRDMEIISYVLGGALEHRDSMGNGSVVGAGEIQYMRAGSGVMHSEYNASDRDVLEFLQIWIVPNRRGSAPAYDQRTIDESRRRNRLHLLAGGETAPDAILIQQDARLFTARLEPGKTLSHALDPGRGAWVQLVTGRLDLNGTPLEAGDGAALEAVPALELSAAEPAELLLFDLGA